MLQPVANRFGESDGGFDFVLVRLLGGGLIEQFRSGGFETRSELRPPGFADGVTLGLEEAIEALEVDDFRMGALGEGIEALLGQLKEEGVVAHQGGVAGNELNEFRGATEGAVRSPELAAAMEGAVIAHKAGISVAGGFEFDLGGVEEVGGVLEGVLFGGAFQAQEATGLRGERGDFLIGFPGGGEA